MPERDETAVAACDEPRFQDGKRSASEQRPFMGQDMRKGRRTEVLSPDPRHITELRLN